MQNDFYVNGIGSGEFGARLLAGYKVGPTGLTRTRLHDARAVQGMIPMQLDYALRAITLPVQVFAASPRLAAEQLSTLTAALAAEDLVLALPNGMQYAASLDAAQPAAEITEDGCLLQTSFALVGYARDDLRTLQLPAGGGTVWAAGTAPAIACRLSLTASAAATAYQMAGVTWQNVAQDDVLVLDGLQKRVLRCGAPDFARCNLISWPTLAPGENTLSAPDALTVEYYPIWL